MPSAESSSKPNEAVDAEPGSKGSDAVVSQLLDAKVADKDESPLVLVGLRDLTVFSVVLAIFGGADSWARTTDLALAQFVVVFLGLVSGVVLAGLGHEWGHFVGARLSGGHAPTKPLQDFPQVFGFDFARNSSKAFIWLSVGGNAGNWGMTLFLALALPIGKDRG